MQAGAPMSRNTWSAMADETATPDEARKRPSASFGKVLWALGLGGPRPPLDADDPDPDATAAGAALRSQAEAFQTITVGDVMTPRADITAVELSTSFEAVVATFAESEHSRLPVYKDTLDDPVGVAHLKDVFRLMADPKRAARADEPVLARLKRPTLYASRSSMRAAEICWCACRPAVSTWPW